MSNQQCMRQWDEGHSSSPSETERHAAVLARHLSGRDQRFFGIGSAYNDNGATDGALLPVLSGLAAVIATTLLMLSAAMMATPGSIFTTLA